MLVHALAAALALVQWPTATVRLAGTIVCTDERGVEHRDWSGSFGLEVLGAQELEVEVVHGRWSTRVQAGRDFAVSWAVLEGRGCIVPWRWRALSEDGFLALEATRQRQPRLRVYDRFTGQELSSVTLFHDFCQAVPCGPYSTPDRVDVPSPVPTLLDPPSWEPSRWKTYWVGAPGYGWQALEVDHARGEDVPVFLHPDPGILEVTIERGHDRPVDVFVARVHGRTRRHVARRAGWLPDLEPGTYRVTVLDASSGPVVRDVQVWAGQTTEVVVRLPLSAPQAEEGLAAEPVGEVLLHVGPDARRIRAAFPHVVWATLDGRARECILRSGGSRPFTWPVRRGRDVSQRRGELCVPGSLPVPFDLTGVAPGETLEVCLEPAASLALAVLDRGRPAWLPDASIGAWTATWDAQTLLRLIPIEAREARVIYHWTEPYVPLLVGTDRGGRYRVEVEAPPGYAPVAPFEVELVVGEVVEVAVELVRTF